MGWISELGYKRKLATGDKYSFHTELKDKVKAIQVKITAPYEEEAKGELC